MCLRSWAASYLVDTHVDLYMRFPPSVWARSSVWPQTRVSLKDLSRELCCNPSPQIHWRSTHKHDHRGSDHRLPHHRSAHSGPPPWLSPQTMWHLLVVKNSVCSSLAVCEIANFSPPPFSAWALPRLSSGKPSWFVPTAASTAPPAILVSFPYLGYSVVFRWWLCM